MNMELFSVMDQCAGRYMDVFSAPTVEFAIRGFREACNTEGHQFSKFPEDYALYHVGSFDATLGALEPLVARKIAIANNFVNGLQLEEEA